MEWNSESIILVQARGHNFPNLTSSNIEIGQNDICHTVILYTYCKYFQGDTVGHRKTHSFYWEYTLILQVQATVKTFFT